MDNFENDKVNTTNENLSGSEQKTDLQENNNVTLTNCEVSPEEQVAIKPNMFCRFKKWFKDFFTYNPVGRRPRIWELDLIRGIILFFVTLDHVCLFAYYWKMIQYKTAFGQVLENFSVFYLESYFRKFVEPIGLWTLCFLSGISCQFSRSSMRRMAKFWIITAVFMGGYAILHFIIPDLITGTFIFNIVPILTISMTLWYVIDHFNVPMVYRIIGAGLITTMGLVFFAIFKLKPGGFWVENPFLAILVYNQNGFVVSPNNFEPLFPHLGFFFLGGIFGRYFYKDKRTKFKSLNPPKALSPILLLGKHSLKAFLFLPFIILAVVWVLVRFVWLFL